MKTQRITIPIYDLSCNGVLIVEHALAQTTGVLHVYINSATEMIYIVYDPAQSDPDHLVEAVEHVGFRTGRPILR